MHNFEDDNRCTGSDACLTHCRDDGHSGNLCGLQTDPLFEGDNLCLGPHNNPLINAGRPATSNNGEVYPMWDDPSGVHKHYGSAPEIGAHEAGVSRRFGHTVISCGNFILVNADGNAINP